MQADGVNKKEEKFSASITSTFISLVQEGGINTKSALVMRPTTLVWYIHCY